MSDVADRRRRDRRGLPRRRRPARVRRVAARATTCHRIVVVENGRGGFVAAGPGGARRDAGRARSEPRLRTRGQPRRGGGAARAVPADLQPRRRRPRRRGGGTRALPRRAPRGRASPVPRSCDPTAPVYPSQRVFPNCLARRPARAARAVVADEPGDEDAIARRVPTARWTGCRVRASSSDATSSRRSAVSTSVTSCSPRTWRCVGRCASTATVWRRSPGPRSPTSRACRAQRVARAMLVAHHRSALRFEWQTAQGVPTPARSRRVPGARPALCVVAARRAHAIIRRNV